MQHYAPNMSLTFTKTVSEIHIQHSQFFVEPFDWRVVNLKLREDAWRCSKKVGGYERRIRGGTPSFTVLLDQLQVKSAKLFHSSYLSGLGKGMRARR